MKYRWWLGAALVCAAAVAAYAQAVVYVDREATVAVDPSRGVDQRVDYGSLVHFGPWDDRNYELTAEDLQVLAPDEERLGDPIPAFFRVAMRKAMPELQDPGRRYPRAAFNGFRIRYGGYRIDGRLYRKATRVGTRWYVDLGEKTSDSTSSGPEFVSGEVRITIPEGAAESAVKVHPVDTNKVIAGTNGPGSGQKMHYSTDGGDTWTETTLPLGGTCCDPGVDWSSDGQFAYAVTLGNCFFSCGVWFYRSDDGGMTWNGLENVTPGDPRRELTNSGSDKEYIHVDGYAGSPFKDRIYLTWHDGNVMQFAYSPDFGNTFFKQSFSGDSAERGIGSDIATDHLGNVYYFWPAFNSRTIRMRKSTDGGETFAPTVVVANTNASFTFPVPSMESREVFVYVAAAADLSGGPFHGSVYAAWTDSTGPTSSTPSANHARIQVAYSRDGGSTWNVTTPHETADELSVDRWHPWLGVGPDGAVHVIFYDTRRDPSRTQVDVFYSRSNDGGQTWTPPERVTTVMSPNIADGFEFGDYNGLDIVGNDLIAVFTDNRQEGGGTGDSVDVYGSGIDPGTGGTCGNDLLEPGEACDGADLGGKTCADFNCTGGGTLACKPDCSGFDTSSCLDCTTCNDNGICESGEDCHSCPNDCVSGTSSGAVCGNGVCEAGDGEDCVSCPGDCNGRQNGKPSARYCCGDGDGVNPISCGDARCTDNGNACSTVPNPGGSFCCGDLVCDGDESCSNCALDCQTSSFEICGNGVDDDCANGADCSDPACASDPSCNATCGDPGVTCTSDADCCSNKCRGPSGGKTCR